MFFMIFLPVVDGGQHAIGGGQYANGGGQYAIGGGQYAIGGVQRAFGWNGGGWLKNFCLLWWRVQHAHHGGGPNALHGGGPYALHGGEPYGPLLWIWRSWTGCGNMVECMKMGNGTGNIGYSPRAMPAIRSKLEFWRSVCQK